MKSINIFVLCAIAVTGITLYLANDKSQDTHTIKTNKFSIQKQTILPHSSKLTTDNIITIQQNKRKLYPLFNPLYVEEVPATDCSFTATFMLMYSHDPDYPFKIMLFKNGSYLVKYPGLDYSITVSQDQIKKFNHVLENKKSLRYFFNKGHYPEGIKILRAAYYEYQRKTGQRTPEYSVYSGGIPIKDLMVLSGIKHGKKIYAVQGFNDIPQEKISFANGLEQQLIIHLENGLFSFKKDGDSSEIGNPFTELDDELSSYLIAVSSIPSISFINNLSGTKIIANHAYYFLGTDEDGNYILGDSYNTRKPVHISPQEFLEKFNAIEYVKI